MRHYHLQRWYFSKEMEKIPLQEVSSSVFAIRCFGIKLRSDWGEEEGISATVVKRADVV